ncbi:DUF4382 domain-containing protein [Marinitoga litoralis]|uniref:DUF4382 domain-containing protein n=1 Tax=Marinitoga litoralis TaxID=570855 RepID=UPI0019607DA3|nr:DUF4382 domain-containing protein [Marinitoga litoralis]MBM7558427.1 hypothetical protein [Marinitoga litoralis]
MKKNYVLILLFTLIVLLSSCFNVDKLNDEKINLKVLLTDKPISNIDSLFVHIEDIYFTYELNGESFETTPVTINKDYDILSLAGTEVSLFNFEIPEGAELGVIHMDVNKNATAVINDDEKNVIVAANGKLVVPNVGINVNYDGELVIDFDVARSLKITGNGYKLIPVLKPSFRRKNATDIFSIKGKVLDVSENPVSKAIITLSATITDEPTIIRVSISNKYGEFYLGKHPNGEYDIKIYTNINLPDDENSDINFDDFVTDFSTTVIINSDDINLNIQLEK